MSAFRTWVATLPPMRGRVRVERVDGVAEIVLDDPPTRNALDPHMMVALADAFDALAEEAVVVLRGEGDAFCSGGNLGVVEAHMSAAGFGEGFGRFMAEATRPRDSMLLVALTGPALGGGAELAVTADTVWAAPRASVGFVHARLGVSPGFGGGERLVRRIGAARALQVLTDARRLSAAEAQALGLVDHVVEDPVHEARAHARRLRELDPEVLRGLVRLVRDPRVEGEVFSQLWAGPAHRAALAARKIR